MTVPDAVAALSRQQGDTPAPSNSLRVHVPDLQPDTAASASRRGLHTAGSVDLRKAHAPDEPRTCCLDARSSPPAFGCPLNLSKAAAKPGNCAENQDLPSSGTWALHTNSPRLCLGRPVQLKAPQGTTPPPTPPSTTGLRLASWAWQVLIFDLRASVQLREFDPLSH